MLYIGDNYDPILEPSDSELARLRAENAELREQLATQAELIIEFQENEKSLKAQLKDAQHTRDLYVRLKRGQTERADEIEARALELLKERDDLQTKLAQAEQERDEQVHQVELAQERLQTAVQLALQGLHERCCEVAALQWFQHEYVHAVQRVRDADEATVFALRKGLPTLTGNKLENL